VAKLGNQIRADTEGQLSLRHVLSTKNVSKQYLQLPGRCQPINQPTNQPTNQLPGAESLTS